MFREDPFFSAKPHRRNYLESLYRTYSAPPSALPNRNNEEFTRALQHRAQEKAYWKSVVTERDSLKSQLNELSTEQDKMRMYFDKLSKQIANGPPSSGSSGDRSVPDRAPNTGEDEGKTDGAVPEQVLLRGDVGGQAQEHRAEGSEPGSGPEATGDATGVQECGEEAL